MWDVFPRPLQTRTAPPIVGSATDPTLNGQLQIGSMNAYDTTIFNLAPNSIYGVRVYEGFSSEEGFPMDFGTLEQEGHASLGVAPLADDFSWAAVVPANVPVHLQMVDEFGLARATEPVWTSGRPGEARICGGCHEERTGVTTTQPGLLHAVVQGPIAMNKPRAQRLSTDYTRGTGTQPNAMGVPWDLAVQPVFNGNCLGCHDAGSTNGWAVDLVDDATGMSVRFSFNLSGAPVNITLGELMVTGYSQSYISMAGFMMEDLEEAGISIVPVRGTYAPGMLPFDYANSPTATRLNPVKQFPTPDVNVRVKTTGLDAVHNDLGLTADEHYILGLASDAGLNFFARENNPGGP